jgi:hypothetical protein
VAETVEQLAEMKTVMDKMNQALYLSFPVFGNSPSFFHSSVKYHTIPNGEQALKITINLWL